jgi:hypothetical protein
MRLKRTKGFWLAAALLAPVTTVAATPREDRVSAISLGDDRPAAADLSPFSFLVGTWACKASVKVAERQWQSFDASWKGSYILDGRAIADEYEMHDLAGNLVVLGMNIRTYDVAKGIWRLRWLNALSGNWTNLAPEEFGGVKISQGSISFYFKEPVAAQAYTRATYTNISHRRFTWIGEKSDDTHSWTDFMKVECRRVEK